MSPFDNLSEILRPGGIRIMFQPIVRFSPQGETLFALEALARGPRGTNMENPEVMFTYARRKNKEVILDQCCLTNALHAAARLPGNPTVSFNVHAATLTTIPNFANWLDSESASVGIHPSRLIIEIIEHAGAFSRTELLTALSQLRSAGVGIAVDDIGLGDANYRMLIDCHPEYLKVDRYVVQGCTSDPYRRAILRATTEVAQSSNSVVVAEGVEREDDMATLLDLGIDLLQGFLISKPITGEELLNSRFLAISMVNKTSDYDAVAEG
jgi:EAL domain-containing protein (putative c-di-GMP-specific phosphodiesterase class I)